MKCSITFIITAVTVVLHVEGSIVVPDFYMKLYLNVIIILHIEKMLTQSSVHSYKLNAKTIIAVKDTTFALGKEGLQNIF